VTFRYILEIKVILKYIEMIMTGKTYLQNLEVVRTTTIAYKGVRASRSMLLILTSLKSVKCNKVSTFQIQFRIFTTL